MDQLPPELVELISFHLCARDLGALASTSTRSRALLRDWLEERAKEEARRHLLEWSSYCMSPRLVSHLGLNHTVVIRMDKGPSSAPFRALLKVVQIQMHHKKVVVKHLRFAEVYRSDGYFWLGHCAIDWRPEFRDIVVPLSQPAIWSHEKSPFCYV